MTAIGWLPGGTGSGGEPDRGISVPLTTSLPTSPASLFFHPAVAAT